MSDDRVTMLAAVFLCPLAGLGAGIFSNSLLIGCGVWWACLLGLRVIKPGRELWARLESDQDSLPSATNLILRRQQEGEAPQGLTGAS